MLKKTVALATLASFLAISWSCYSWKKAPLLSIKPEKRTNVKISALQVNSGEIVEFNKHPAARIQGDSVAGMRLVKNFTLEKVKIKVPLSMKTGVGYRIVTTDGVVYNANPIISQDDSSVTFDNYFEASIPLANVDFVWIRQADELRSFILMVSVPIGILLGLVFLFGHDD